MLCDHTSQLNFFKSTFAGGGELREISQTAPKGKEGEEEGEEAALRFRRGRHLRLQLVQLFLLRQFGQLGLGFGGRGIGFFSRFCFCFQYILNCIKLKGLLSQSWSNRSIIKHIFSAFTGSEFFYLYESANLYLVAI